MKRMQRVFGNLDALRYVDNRLDDERKAAFLSHLAEDPQEAERIAVWSRQNDVIRAAFASVAVEPIPLWLRLGHVAGERPVPAAPTPVLKPVDARPVTRLADQRRVPRAAEEPIVVEPGRARPPRGRPALSFGLSALLLVIAGLAIVYVAHIVLPTTGNAVESFEPPLAAPMAALVSRATDAYRTYAVDLAHPVEFSAAQGATLDHWLQRRVPVAVHAPDLRPEGWTLLGGRLVPADSSPGAYLVYEDETGERLGLFVARSGTAPVIGPAIDAIAGGGATLGWTSGQTAYVVTVGRSMDWLSRNADALRFRIGRAG